MGFFAIFIFMFIILHSSIVTHGASLWYNNWQQRSHDEPEGSDDRPDPIGDLMASLATASHRVTVSEPTTLSTTSLTTALEKLNSLQKFHPDSPSDSKEGLTGMRLSLSTEKPSVDPLMDLVKRGTLPKSPFTVFNMTPNRDYEKDETPSSLRKYFNRLFYISIGVLE